MFELNEVEAEILRSQIGTLNYGRTSIIIDCELDLVVSNGNYF